MIRSIPQLVAAAAILLGIVLFAWTLTYIDLRETLDSARHLGLALPVILLPGLAWQILRTWGWAVAFPDRSRPAFTRLFRVRLAADAISFFTIRGIAGEPLKVVLLYDRVGPQVTTAAVTLERLAFAIVGIVMAGLVSVAAVTRLNLPRAWDTLFGLLGAGAVLLIGLLAIAARYRTGAYLKWLVHGLDRLTGRRLETARAVRFILEVEEVLLQLLRGGRRRLLILTTLPILCYLVMTVEVWLVFWAIGAPIGITQSLTVETFARLASVASAAIPGNMGALEASNAAVVSALGLGGGGSLALARRIRALLWAAVGLTLYPRVRARKTRD